MKNKNFIKCLADNWQVIVGVCCFGIASILVILNDNCFKEHFVLFGTAIIFFVVAGIFKKVEEYNSDIPSFIMLSGIYLLVLAIMWEFPISIIWSLIPTAIIIAVTLTYERFSGMIALTGIVAIMLMIIRDGRLTKEYLESQKPETVVINYVEKRSQSNIQVYIEGRGIFRFSTSIKDKWKLNDGDTVQVVIREGTILKLIQ